MIADFEPADPHEAPASIFLAAMVAEMKALYGIGEDRHVGVPLEIKEMAPPAGVYLVGWIGEMAVAGGAVRTIGDGLGEIKRMYVHPDFRGRGLAAQLLAALEDHAVSLGLHTVRLDTGSKQPAAQHLYEKSGYASIGNYNQNRDAAFWGEKRLK